MFHHHHTWSQRVLTADSIYKKVVKALDGEGLKLPTTPRRPDIRLILENKSGADISFMNPGDHAKQQPETIPATGDSKAVMVMLKGNTLEEQYANAQKLDAIFKLSEKGLTKVFAAALGNAPTSELVAEAYGPAPFSGQASRLVPLDWKKADDSHVVIAPYQSNLCAYGARQAEQETVFRTEVSLFIKGTNTIPECIEGEGMCIAVSQDWKTGKISTRPIVPSVAKDFYGAAYDNIPTVLINPLGFVQSIDLHNDKPSVNVEPPKRFRQVLQELR